MDLTVELSSRNQCWFSMCQLNGDMCCRTFGGVGATQRWFLSHCAPGVLARRGTGNKKASLKFLF